VIAAVVAVVGALVDGQLILHRLHFSPIGNITPQFVGIRGHVGTAVLPVLLYRSIATTNTDSSDKIATTMMYFMLSKKLLLNQVLLSFKRWITLCS
jgi:hypothetical protein